MKSKALQGLAALLTLIFGLWLLWDRGFFALMAARLEPEPERTGLTIPSLPDFRGPYALTPAARAADAEAETLPAAEALSAERQAPRVNNVSREDPDLAALLREGWGLRLREDGDAQILIYHTHATEAYRNDPADPYEETDPGHTTDETKNMLRVGDELSAALTEAGFCVLHDRTMYDYPEYNGAYGRSAAAVEEILEAHPGIRVVIDLHRNSAPGTENETEGAQILLLLTTGDAGLYHPNWEENLRLGLLLQSELERELPTLTKPLYLCSGRYNQQLSPGAFLLELGCDTDSLSEALQSAERFAVCIAEVLRGCIQP